MKRLLYLTVLFFALPLSWHFLVWPLKAQIMTTSTPVNLKSAIDEKTKQLGTIMQQIQATEQNLNQTKTQSTSIQKDITKLGSNINTLNLRIKASAITIDKLTLELQDLSGQMEDTLASIDEKKEGIAAALRVLQQKDSEAMLITFLRTKSLADSLLEIQNLSDLNTTLASQISSLGTLQDSLSQAIDIESQKKSAIELERENASNRKEIAEDQKQEREQLLNLTKTQQKAYETQLSDLQKQQASISDQIDALDEELRKSFNESVLPSKGPGVFTMPIQGRITQYYGEVSSLYRGKPHNGLDIGAPIGTPVLAAGSGTVFAVDNNDKSSRLKYQYGKYVLIKHSNGLATLYAHLSRQVVSPGQVVKRGELIGYSGNTGYATGPHLHLGLYWAATISLKSIPPAAGLVPVGVTLNISDYI